MMYLSLEEKAAEMKTRQMKIISFGAYFHEVRHYPPTCSHSLILDILSWIRMVAKMTKFGLGSGFHNYKQTYNNKICSDGNKS